MTVEAQAQIHLCPEVEYECHCIYFRGSNLISDI